MAKFRFVHASDLHLGSTPARLPPLAASPVDTLFVYFSQTGVELTIKECETHDPAVSLAFARWLHQAGEALDFVLFTGDISTTGSEADLLSAIGFFGAPAAPNSKPWLSEFGGRATIHGKFDIRRIILLPGNHDRYHESKCRPGNSAFDRHFVSYWPRNAKSGSRISAELIRDLDYGERVAVIAADFTLVHEHQQKVPAIGYLGEGLVDMPTLEQLERATTKIREQFSNVAVIWAVHFAPLSSTPRLLALANHDLLIESASRNGVEHIFCGHVHKASRPRVNGVNVHVCSTTLAASSGHVRSFVEYEIEVTQGKIAQLRSRSHSYGYRGSQKGNFSPSDWN